MRTHAERRAGFTLVEVVVVVSLIAVLAALAAGAFFRIQAGQNRSNAETSLNKVHSVLQTKWKVVIDDARKTVPDGLVKLCGNDRDRALVVWTYAKLKNELPDTPEEAQNDVSVPVILPDGTVGVATLTKRQAFQAVAAACVASRSAADPQPADTAAEAAARQDARESGALLLAAISQTGGGGNVQGQDGLGGQIATPGPATKNLQYYKDSWDRPVGFIRHAYTAEIDVGDNNTTAAAPTVSGTTYTKLTTINGLVRPVRTGLDPGGKLIPINPWLLNPSNVATRTAIITALNANRSVGPGGRTTISLANQNCVETLYSAGPNKDFGDVFGNNDDGADNILSFRLRREGARGD